MKKLVKKGLGVLVIVAVLLTAVACGSKTVGTPAADGTVSLKIGNTQSEADLQSQAMVAVKDRMAEATDGKFVIENFFSSSLGDTDDLLEQAMQGADIVALTDPSRLASFVHDIGILGMPYIMDDYTDLDKIMQTGLYQEWMDEFEKQGMWVITSNWYSGARNFALNKVVHTPEDLNGQRIRTIGNDICTNSINAMGAVASPMSWSEVYTSVSQGALDGAEVQTPSFYSTRLWEVINTINRTEHFQLVANAVTGTAFRDSIPEEYQKLLADTFFAVGSEFQKKTVDACTEWEKEMSEEYGLTVNEDVDVQAFKDASAKCYEELGMVEIRDRLQEEMAKVG